MPKESVSLRAKTPAGHAWADAATVRLDPDDPATHYSLACELADCPDPDGRLAFAFDHAARAYSLSGWKNDGYRQHFLRLAGVRQLHAREKEYAEARPSDPCNWTGHTTRLAASP